MITIKVYKNGYEIKGHSDFHTCSEVSFWHWCTSNLFLGLDGKAKEYTSHKDNEENPNEGYSWLTINRTDLSWTFEDLVVSAKRWQEEFWKEKVKFVYIDDMLIKN